MQSGPLGEKHFFRRLAASEGCIEGGVSRGNLAPSFSAKGRLSSLISVMAMLLAPRALQLSRLRSPASKKATFYNLFNNPFDGPALASKL